jgi:hypothetical protein
MTVPYYTFPRLPWVKGFILDYSESGNNLKIVWVNFSTLSLTVFVIMSVLIGKHMHGHI